MKPASYRHILKFTSLLGSVQVVYILLSVVRNKISTVLIGAAGLGFSDLLMRAATFVGDATNFGIAFSAVRRLSVLHEEGREDELRDTVCTIRSWVLFTALFGALICFLCAPLLSRFLNEGSENIADLRAISPIVAFLTLTAGEAAILKATCQLKRLATIMALGAVSTLACTAPLYYAFRMQGVVPALILSTGCLFLLHLWATTRHFPYHLDLRRYTLLHRGRPLLVLGVAYIVAGLCGSGAEFFVRAFLKKQSEGWDVVGLYAAGFTLTVNYARYIFVAMDADYFPRLSAAMGHKREMNITINRQIEILVMLMVPFLIIFCLSLPLIIRLLYIADFLQIIPMVLCAASYMYFKAVFAPVAYLPLAAGHAALYMTMEVIYDFVFVVLVGAGFLWNGLVGAGIALSASNLFNLLLVFTIYAFVYHFRIHGRVLLWCAVQYVLLVGGLVLSTMPQVEIKILGGVVLISLSLALSWPLLRASLLTRFKGGDQ